MAITPAPGYQIDPSNPNGVIPIGQAPAAQAPVTPAPTIQTPAAPGISTPAAFKDMTPPAPPPVQVNVNNGQQPQAKPQANTPAPGAGPLAMPGNGSVVDLLNAAGTDSSFANRSTLAQQYGIQGYTGTAAQNQELAKKYLDAFNANKNTKVPDTPAQAQSALDTFFEENTPAEKNPQAAFFDAYAEMNPVVKTLYDTINKELSSVGRQISFTEQYQKLVTEQGIPGLQTDLLNIERIMDGTEDDIREEITKVGGFATESQVQALKGARNKTLLKQANFLQGQLQMRNDYVKQIMELTQADREQVERDVDRKLGLTTKLFELTEKMQDGAKENYQNVVDIGEKRGVNGYAYLAESLGGDPTALRLAETTMGLPTGALSSPAFLASVKKEDWSEPYKLGGSYVQKNLKTGEIRTAADIPSAGGGISGPTSYQEWVLAGSPGTYADYLKDKSTKAPTVAQQTVSTYAARLEQSNPTISQLESYVANLSPAKFETQKRLPSYFQTAEYQQFDQAARNIINAILRRESGAVISPSEFDNAYKQYLPRAGDTKETLAQKKTVRDLTYNAYKNAAGNAFQSVDELLGITPTPGAPKKGDTRVYEGHPYTFNGKEWELKK